MLRTIFGDHERFTKTYFGEIDGVYFAGDGARKDADGYFWIMGRVDDVINVAGHRLSTMEVEARWSRTRRSPKPRSSAGPTT